MAAAAAVVGGLVVAGGSIAGGMAQQKGLERAQSTQERLQQRQLAFARQQLAKFDPFLDTASSLIKNLQSQSSRPSSQDPLFKEALRNTRGFLSSTGNLRSGFAQDTVGRLALEAEARRFDRGLAVAGLAGKVGIQGNELGANLYQNGLAVSNNISQIQAAIGANAGSTIQSAANAIGGGISAAGGGYGGIAGLGQNQQYSGMFQALQRFNATGNIGTSNSGTSINEIGRIMYG